NRTLLLRSQFEEMIDSYRLALGEDTFGQRAQKSLAALPPFVPRFVGEQPLQEFQLAASESADDSIAHVKMRRISGGNDCKCLVVAQFAEAERKLPPNIGTRVA